MTELGCTAEEASAFFGANRKLEPRAVPLLTAGEPRETAIDGGTGVTQ